MKLSEAIDILYSVLSEVKVKHIQNAINKLEDEIDMEVFSEAMKELERGFDLNVHGGPSPKDGHYLMSLRYPPSQGRLD